MWSKEDSADIIRLIDSTHEMFQDLGNVTEQADVEVNIGGSKGVLGISTMSTRTSPELAPFSPSGKSWTRNYCMYTNSTTTHPPPTRADSCSVLWTNRRYDQMLDVTSGPMLGSSKTLPSFFIIHNLFTLLPNDSLLELQTQYFSFFWFCLLKYGTEDYTIEQTFCAIYHLYEEKNNFLFWGTPYNENSMK